MFFNSYQFFIFFSVVVAVFFSMPQRFRWIFLLGASYFYYMVWNPKYAVLIMTTTLIVYGTALLMNGKTPGVKKFYVALSVVSNLLILFLFKYFNFFNATMKELFGGMGVPYDVPALKLLLPVGISFYTFQALSYTIDVYRGVREPERHLGLFALYVSFFPVILSGPIERSTTLLPQFYEKMEFDYQRVTDGLKLMAWGFFQKLVIADRLGHYVNVVYANPEAHAGLPLMLGTYLFVIQVYCDFSGYTDLAIGTAQVMGYRLLPNFRRPYFARSLADLWRRWHITLISWFRDYLYIPLGGNRVPPWRFYLNMIIVFTLSGLWHGAQWTFVIWGSLNGVFLIISRMTQGPRDRVREWIFGAIRRAPAPLFFFLAALPAAAALLGGAGPVDVGIGARIGAGAAALVFAGLGLLRTREPAYASFVDGAKTFWMVAATFHLFLMGAVFFRAKNVADAWYILTHFAGTNFGRLMLHFDPIQFSLMILLGFVLFAVHYIQETRGSIRKMIMTKPLAVRWALYALLGSSIVLLGVRGADQFIYFQF